MLLFNPCINATHVQSQSLLRRLFFMIIESLEFIFFLILIPHATPLNFDLPEITSQQNNLPINTYAKAYVTSSMGLLLTPYQPDVPGLYWPQKAGRATYALPLHLWDKASSGLSSFRTHFSFSIDSGQSTVHGDGLAFFLLPDVTDFGVIPVTPGGALGLPINGSQSFPFLAVEFDTWRNDWDPQFSRDTHVGININSLKSVAASVWDNSITGGDVANEAWISYSYDTKLLSVGFTGFLNDSSVTQHSLSYAVDVRDYLPEWVALGFSASTGSASENHVVYSWNFSSHMSFTPSTASENNLGGKRNKSPLVVVAGFVVIMLSVVNGGLLW